MGVDVNARYLIVDDFSLVRTLLRRALEDLGITQIHEASNGREALTMLKAAQEENNHYHAMFLDWTMPEMDGYQVLQACQNEDIIKDTPIFMVTAESDKDKIMKVLNMGVYDYIVKPFNINTIKNKLIKLKQENQQSA